MPLEYSLENLLHRAAIDDLLTRYTIAVDDENYDLLDTVFTSDAVLDYSSAGGPRAPYPEVKQWLREGLNACHPVRQHIIAQKQVNITGETAIVRAYFFNPFTFLQADGNPSYSLGGGYYNHKLVLGSEGWRSVELYELRVWRQGHPPRAHPHAARAEEDWDFGQAPRPRPSSSVQT